MFNKHVDARNLIGIVVAMVGVVWYTEVKRTETLIPLNANAEILKSYNEARDPEAGFTKGSTVDDDEKVSLLEVVKAIP